MSEHTPTGHDEQHEKPLVEVWVIEDDNMLRGMVQAHAAQALGEGACRGFEKSEDALQELSRRISAGEPLPTGIFVDGNLDKDSGEFSRGPDVVEKIRAMEKDTPAMIVAFSSKPELNEAMIKKGATTALEKPPKRGQLGAMMEKIKEYRQ